MEKSAKIFVAGHRGMVGSAIVRKLHAEGFSNLILKSRKELDLCNQAEVAAFFASEKPEFVFLAAAKVGGIVANNSRRAEFIYENLMIEANVIHQAHLNGVHKLLFLGSSCIYPKMAEQPITEDALLSGILEPTNEPYAIAKIAGIKLCEAYRAQYGANFISAMPTNLYGPNDNYDLEGSHVLPAMIRKFWEAKQNAKSEVILWGDGSPRREFLHVDDAAAACLHLMKTYDQVGFVNVGTGVDVTIKALAETIQKEIGYEGIIHWDTTKPNGTPRKWLDVSRLHSLGFHHQIDLQQGIRATIQDFVAHHLSYTAGR